MLSKYIGIVLSDGVHIDTRAENESTFIQPDREKERERERVSMYLDTRSYLSSKYTSGRVHRKVGKRPRFLGRAFFHRTFIFPCSFAVSRLIDTLPRGMFELYLPISVFSPVFLFFSITRNWKRKYLPGIHFSKRSRPERSEFIYSLGYMFLWYNSTTLKAPSRRLPFVRTE